MLPKPGDGPNTGPASVATMWLPPARRRRVLGSSGTDWKRPGNDVWEAVPEARGRWKCLWLGLERVGGVTKRRPERSHSPEGAWVGNNVHRGFMRLVKRAGVKRCTIHGLRRTFVGQLAMAGVSAAVTQKLAGRTIEPAVCVPSAYGTTPRQTAAAEPLEEVPGVRRASCGLMARPSS